MQAGEAAAASEAPSALDVENKAILVALNEADQYYQEQVWRRGDGVRVIPEGT